MLDKLDWVHPRLEELGVLLSDPQVVQDQARWRALMQEHSRLEPLAAAARRYAKISRAWVEHDVILDGQRGMKVHLYLTVSGMKRRSVSLTGEVTLDSDVAGDDPEVIYRCDGALMPSHDIDTYLDYTLFVNYDTGNWPEGDHHYYLNVLVTNTANGEALNTPGSTILDF